MKLARTGTLFLTLFFLANFAYAKSPCAFTAELDRQAYHFMSKHGIIRPGEEQPGPVSSKWTLTKVNTVENRCLLTMDLCTTLDSIVYCENSALEVLGLKDGQVVFFEDLFPIPKILKVGIGEGCKPDESGNSIPIETKYYSNLSGASVLAAFKTIKLQFAYSGLMAEISAKNIQVHESGLLYGEPDGAVEFDPTKGRSWKLKNSTWDLRRGLTAEIMDIYPAQIDEDFLSYFSGGGGNVGPWAAYLLTYFDEASSKWTETGVVAKACKD